MSIATSRLRLEKSLLKKPIVSSDSSYVYNYIMFDDIINRKGGIMKMKNIEGIKVRHSVEKPRRLAFRIFWAAFLLMAAAMILLQSFGVLEVEVNVGIVVALLALLGLTLMFLLKMFWMAAFMAATSALVIASNTGLIMSFTGEQQGVLFMAAAMIAIALHVLFRRRRLGCLKFCEDGSNDMNASFTGVTRRVKDQAFERANLSCRFGEIKVYFDDVKLKGKKAIIHIDSSFGGVELYLPKHWAVDSALDVSFGEIEEKNQPAITSDSPQIVLEGTVNFGGIAITYI